jgi:hypothetical protein
MPQVDPIQSYLKINLPPILKASLPVYQFYFKKILDLSLNFLKSLNNGLNRFLAFKQFNFPKQFNSLVKLF